MNVPPMMNCQPLSITGSSSAEKRFISAAEKAYERAERNTKPSPVSLNPPPIPLRLMRTTPEKPAAQPSIFLNVSFSVLNISEATSIERNTFEAVMTELFIPVLRARPM